MGFAASKRDTFTYSDGISGQISRIEFPYNPPKADFKPVNEALISAVLKRNDSSSKLSLNSSPDTKTTESLNNSLNKYSGSSLFSTIKTGSLIGDSSDIPLSQRLTGTYSPEFEAYLLNLEKQYGTMYMSEHVFGGDLNVYDPYKRASELTGIPLEKDGKSPVNCGSAGRDAFNNALYGEGSGDTDTNHNNTSLYRSNQHNGSEFNYNFTSEFNKSLDDCISDLIDNVIDGKFTDDEKEFLKKVIPYIVKGVGASESGWSDTKHQLNYRQN